MFTCIARSAACGLVALLFFPSRADCQADSGITYTKAEQLILRQVADGKIATFGDLPAKRRTVPAEFVAQLLTGKLAGVSVSNEGVLIEHAVVHGKLGVAGAEIRYTVWLNDCDFEGGADLSRTHLHGDLSATNSRFHGDADFDGLRADGNIFFQNATFDGLFDISGSQIHGSLNAAGAVFSDQDGQPAQFDSMTGLVRADFENITLKVPLTLDGAEAQILWLGAIGNSAGRPNADKLPVVKQVILTHATVHRELHLEGMNIDTLLASSLKVEGLADFENLKITTKADLSHSQLFDLILTDDITWPSREESFDLAGIFFQYISPESHWSASSTPSASTDAHWTNLLKLADTSNYPTAPYQQLEDALRREGRIDLANSVFENKEKKARSRGNLGWEATIKNFLLYALIGYGREPQRAFYWSALVVLFGWLVVFRTENDVQLRDDKDKGRHYDAFWYSLDLFLPIATLQAADVWIPRQSSWIKRSYAGIHAVLGWILIPIGLAAVTGLVSGK
jgi:hypothetical protein